MTVTTKKKARAQGFTDAALILAKTFGIDEARLQEVSVDSHVSPRTEDTASDITLRVTVLEHDDPQVLLNRVEIDKRKRAEARAEARDKRIKQAVKDYNANVAPFQRDRQDKVDGARRVFHMETDGFRAGRNYLIAEANRIYNEGK